MDVMEAKQLGTGVYVYHTSKKNADGKTPMRARVTSVKTWKTRPDKVEVHVKHGLRDYAVFNQDELDQISTISEALNK